MRSPRLGIPVFSKVLRDLSVDILFNAHCCLRCCALRVQLSPAHLRLPCGGGNRIICAQVSPGGQPREVWPHSVGHGKWLDMVSTVHRCCCLYCLS
jgi:hypothetical protein